VVARFRPLHVVLSPVVPFVFFHSLILKIAHKRAIPPTLRTTALNHQPCLLNEIKVQDSVVFKKYQRCCQDVSFSFTTYCYSRNTSKIPPNRIIMPGIRNKNLTNDGVTRVNDYSIRVTMFAE